jgi:hypothetical protein
MTSVAVAIVTARSSKDVYNDFIFENWADLIKSTNTPGDLKALILALYNRPVLHHVQIQLRALALQTVKPDEVIIVDRLVHDHDAFLTARADEYPLPFQNVWVAPKLSAKELEICPESAFDVRLNTVPYGCSDKNTAIVHAADHDALIMLDDGCIPTPTLVEEAQNVCAEGNVLLFGHRKLLNDDPNRLEFAEANWHTHTEAHCPFGIWAVPTKYLFALNGYNENMDGQRTELDKELYARMQRYLAVRDKVFVQSPQARVYEVGHNFPWTSLDVDRPWTEFLNAGWKAPGPNLQAIAKASGFQRKR